MDRVDILDGDPAPPPGVPPINHTLLYLLPVVVGFLLPLASLPIITRAVNREDYGAWALTNVYATLATSLCGLGLPVVFERNFFECAGDRQRASLLYSTVGFVSLSYAIAGAATVIWARPLSLWITGSPEYPLLLILSFAGAALIGIKAYYLIYFRNIGAPRDFVRYSIDENVTGVLLTILFVAVLQIGVVGLAMGPLLASTWVLAAVMWRTSRRVPLAFDAQLLRASISLAAPLTPRILLKAIAGNFDKYLVAQLSSIGGAGIYALGQKVAYGVFTVMTAFENAFGPKVYDQMFRGGPSAGVMIGRLLTPFIYASVGVALLVVTFATEIITLLAAPTYRQAVPVTALLAAYYAVLFFGKLPQLVYAKRVSLMLAVSTGSVVINIVLCGWFAARWGAVGAAAGTAIGGVLSTSIYMILGQRHFAIRWSYDRLAWMYGCLLAAVIVALVADTPGVSYGAGLTARLAVIGVYAWLGVRFGIVTRATITDLTAAARHRLGRPTSQASR